MIPSKTLEKIGPSQAMACRRRPPDAGYVLTGSDLNDLACLVVRLGSRMDDANETRDWQNRIALMLSQAEILR